MTDAAARLKSPDGELELVIEIARVGGDAILSFAGSDWHLHGDSLAEPGECPEAAVRRVADEVMRDKVPIVVERHPGGLANIWLNLRRQRVERGSGAPVIVRRWSGCPGSPRRAARQLP
jgi:hypothetical protein